MLHAVFRILGDSGYGPICVPYALGAKADGDWSDRTTQACGSRKPIYCVEQ